MIYRLCDMIYGISRMIYLLRNYDIISVPIIREAYIIRAADIIPTGISSVTAGNGYHWKKLDLRTNQAFFWCGLPDLNRYGCPHAPQTCASAYSAKTALRLCYYIPHGWICQYPIKNFFLYNYFNGDILRREPKYSSALFIFRCASLKAAIF